MKECQSILFVSHGTHDETEALHAALELAKSYKSSLDVLIVYPLFPSSHEDYKKSYELFLVDNINKAIDAAKTKLSLNSKHVPIKVDIDSGDTPDILIIQRVIRHDYDLLIKAVEPNDSKGFKALDMALLRKCPCPVFLHRPFKHNKKIHIAVAIDVKDDDEPSGHDFAMELLNLSHSLALHSKGNLSIISCWDFVLEHYLRNSILIDITPGDLDKMVMEESNQSYNQLEALVRESAINHDKPHIYHLKGKPNEIIPSIITEQQIDILVMGTVARTGISGFIIGNTAEDILQNLDCSLWALKPSGFVSPVKAY